MRRTSLTLLSILAVGALVFTGCAKGGENAVLQVRGSDTELNLVQRLSEKFMEDNPAQIAVTGGGSGTGLAALINGEVDLANASRAMKDKEIEQAKANNVNPVEFVVAMDGLSVIVHKDNPVEKLTVAQIGAIYRGEITNWQEVGGNDQKISLYGRQNNSGTFVFFREHVLKGDYSADMKRMNGNAQIVEGVKADPAGIGYVGLGYVVDENGNPVEGLTVLKVAKDKNSPYVSPLNREDVLTGAYPVARPLYQYTNGKPQGALRDFIKYELGEKGQNIAIDEGFFPVPKDLQQQNQANLGS